MFSRIDGFYAPPDTLLEKASGIKLELLRYRDEEGDVDVLVSYEIHGELTDDDQPLLAKLLSQFQGKAGAQ